MLMIFPPVQTLKGINDASVGAAGSIELFQAFAYAEGSDLNLTEVLSGTTIGGGQIKLFDHVMTRTDLSDLDRSRMEVTLSSLGSHQNVDIIQKIVPLADWGRYQALKDAVRFGRLLNVKYLMTVQTADFDLDDLILDAEDDLQPHVAEYLRAMVKDHSSTAKRIRVIKYGESSTQVVADDP
jgi:hypothetical protein